MTSPRLPDRPSVGRRRIAAPPALPPGLDPPQSVADLMFRSWPGRLFIISAGLKLVVGALRLIGELPRFVQILSSAATIGLILSVGYFVWRLFVLTKRRLLWRVRRKLILSYIFIGVVPALLIIVFFLLGGVVIFMNVSAYLFKDGYDEIVDYVKLTTEAVASELSRTPETALQSIARIHRNAAKPYPALSFVFVPMPDAPIERLVAGRWEHMAAPSALPGWLRGAAVPGSSIALPSQDSPDRVDLVIRAAMPVTIDGTLSGYVIGDLPVSVEIVQRLQDATSVRASAVTIIPDDPDRTAGALGKADGASQAANSTVQTLFRKSVIFLDYLDWNTGATHRVSVALSYRLGELYRRLSSAQQILMGTYTFGEMAMLALALVAFLFLIIEFVALLMGLALARSITSSIHQLFMGTERVRQGDFGHRIDIDTKDQLGELAGSFNQMTGSIEGLLQTAAEKKRLEEELRIARVIQMSLLPRGPLDVPGLAITALCVPAREVGGDYYDFFQLPGDRLGVLIADVSGKGTSAALYMAELKGLVLALSQMYESPRKLLIEVNRIISEHLDSRSFITMTYAVLDVQQGSMTFCRAGHTPLIFLPAPSPTAPAARVLTPSGMVLGLRIDGAAEKFSELLEEERVDLATGDVIVLYTDGITEAMNRDQDLFGESRLSRIVEEHGHLDSGELRERILREIEAFVGGADQHDDMTMILLKVDRAFISTARVAV